MKASTRLAAPALVAWLAMGCTFHVGDDIDSDFFDDDSSTPSPTATHRADASRPGSDASDETDSGYDESDSGYEETDSGNVSEDSGSDTDSATPVTSSSADAQAPAPSTSSSSMPQTSYLCSAPSSEDECDRCLKASCQYQREACCGSSCEEYWPAVQKCMAMVVDPGDPAQAQADLERCLGEAAPSGDPYELDTEEEFQLLLSCVNSDYEGGSPDDPFGRYPGDGMCTGVCYNVPTLMTD